MRISLRIMVAGHGGLLVCLLVLVQLFTHDAKHLIFLIEVLELNCQLGKGRRFVRKVHFLQDWVLERRPLHLDMRSTVGIILKL